MAMILFIVFSDEDIFKLKSGDPLVFEKVFNEYHHKIYNFLVIKTNGNEHVAEEIFSDTFYSALTSAHSIKDAKKIFPWLLQIARRRFADHLRKKYRNKDIESEEEISDDLHSKDYVKEQNEKAILVNMAMENIRPEYKNILNLKYIEDKSQKEISAIYGKSESSIESLLFRARDALKKEMKKMIKDS